MPVIKYFGEDGKVHAVTGGGSKESEVVDSSDGNFTDKAMSQRAAKAYTDSKQDLLSASGQIIQVETAVAGIPALAIAGKTYQDGTSSPDTPALIHGAGESLNLLNIPNQTQTANGVTVIVKGGEINISGTAAVQGYITIAAMTLSAGTYYFDQNLSGSNLSTLVQKKGGSVRFIERKGTFVLNEDTVVEMVVWHGSETVRGLLHPMLVRGSEAKPWQPYGHHLKICRTGKNLFDGKLKIGAIDISTGDFVAAPNFAITENPILIDGENELIASVSFKWSEAYFCFFSCDGKYLGYKYLNKTGTIPKGTRYVFFEMRSEDGEAIDLSRITDLMIENGVKTSAYDPYQGQEITYPLSSPLYGGDQLHPDGKIIRRKRKLIVTGDENFIPADPNNPAFTYFVFDGRDKSAICSHFIHQESGGEYIEKYTGFNMYSSYGVIYFNFTGVVNSISEFKSWLKAQQAAGTPVTILYELDEPEIEYTAPDQTLELIAGSNVIQDAGVYPADLTLYYSRSGMPVFNAVKSDARHEIDSQKHERKNFYDNDAILGYLAKVPDQLENNTHYYVAVNICANGLVLDGGIWLVEGYKADDLYQYQIARIYTLEGVKEMKRSKVNGTWMAFV